MYNRYRVQFLHVSHLRKVSTREIVDTYQEVKCIHYTDLIQALNFARQTEGASIYDRLTNTTLEFSSH